MRAGETAAALLRPGRTCWAVSPVTGSGVLVDGRDYFRAFYHAARAARRYILVAGWQFDSDVELLRGADRSEEREDVRLLPFLRTLCRANPELRVQVLCWDYSPAYMLDREWLQDAVFNWTTPDNLSFRFDDRHAIGGSHHQKFVVIDGQLAFVGSMDLCHGRWDLRSHPPEPAVRQQSRGEGTYGPYHEVQAWLSGPAVGDVEELFVARWRTACGEDLSLPPPATEPPTVVGGLRLHGAREAGLSRTNARTLVPEQPSIREIAALYRDAVLSAERLIYVENQYFSSKVVFDAMVERLRDASRPRLNVAIVCPRQLKSFTENLSMGPMQEACFRRLRAVARERGHALEIFAATTPRPGGFADRYIHSKLLIVDDRLLSVGSANTNNRSMGLDTELNATWEAGPGDETLARSIRKVRLSLLAEHAAARGRRDLRALAEPDGMVAALLRAARDPERGLRIHPAEGGEDEPTGFDPEGPVVEEELFEPTAPSRLDMMRAGVRRIRWRFRRPGRRERSAVNTPMMVAGAPPLGWIVFVQSVRRLLVPVIAFLLVFGVSVGVYALIRWIFD